MMKKILLLVLLLCCSCKKFNTVDSVIDSVVFVRNVTQGWSGSGFAIDDHTIVTARHVVEGGKVFAITMTPRQSEKMQIQFVCSDAVAMSNEYDIAYIVFEGHPFKPVELGSFSGCRVGDSVFAIGSPYGFECFNNVTSGIISALERGPLERWNKLFQIDAPCWCGSSGGPIFSEDGKIIGILVGGLSPDFCFAIPIDVLKEI